MLNFKKKKKFFQNKIWVQFFVFLSSFFFFLLMEVVDSTAAKHIYCAHNVKTVRLCTEFFKTWPIFFRYATHCGISKMTAIDFEGYSWFKNWNMRHFLWKEGQLVCFIIRIPQTYSLTHFRRLVFKLHIEGYRKDNFKVQGSKSNIAPIFMKHISNCYY